MAEESKHVVHHVDSDKKKQSVKVLRSWQFLAAVFAILLVASIGTSGFRMGKAGALSEEQISKKAADYINQNILQGQGIATVSNVKDFNGLYLLTIDINGQLLEVYATKDGALLFPQVVSINEAPEGNSQEGSAQEAPASARLEVGEAPVKGSEDAPVTIIEFSDLSCPFCGAAAGKNKDAVNYMTGRDPSWEAPLPGIIKNYVDTGKAKLAFKYFPGHGAGEEAMKLAWCSDEQGMFWEVHDAFFENQNIIEDAEKLKELAVEVGVDRAKLEDCYESGRYDGRLASDASEGRAAGVSGTPTFFINGVLVSGAQSFSVFKNVIEAELAD